MVVNMDETRLTPIAQIGEFLAAGSQLGFSAHGGDTERCAHIGRVLRRFDHPRRTNYDRGVLLAYLRHTHLRKSTGYQARRMRLTKSCAVCNPIGVRKAPRPNGHAGWVRIDTLHQGDLDGLKRVDHITCVDAMSQWQAQACVQGISEAFLSPVLALVIAQFPFQIEGFHSNNGFEHINGRVARMREKPGGERLTTAALAARLQVSEAALYRHFASKAQLYERLIEFIEQSEFSLINQIADVDAPPGGKAARVVAVLLKFGERNPGMTRVMVGDALVLENKRLQQRMNLFLDKIEATLRRVLYQVETPRVSPTPSVDAQVQASLLTAFAVGRLQRFARSGFKRLPSEHMEACLAGML